MTLATIFDEIQEFSYDWGGVLTILLIGLLGWMLERRPPAERTRAAQDLYATLAAHHGPSGVQFDSATWLVTARRT